MSNIRYIPFVFPLPATGTVTYGALIILVEEPRLIDLLSFLSAGNKANLVILGNDNKMVTATAAISEIGIEPVIRSFQDTSKVQGSSNLIVEMESKRYLLLQDHQPNLAGHT